MAVSGVCAALSDAAAGAVWPAAVDADFVVVLRVVSAVPRRVLWVEHSACGGVVIVEVLDECAEMCGSADTRRVV